MTDLQQQETILSLPKPNNHKWKYPSGTLPPWDSLSYKPERVGKRYGLVTIINPEFRYRPVRKNNCYTEVRCDQCRQSGWVIYENLVRGLSRGCPRCGHQESYPYPGWISRRLTDAKQRCENPKKPSYSDYGARGIKFDFPSIHEAAMYVWTHLSPLDPSLTIDRIDNNGNYAPGNLRLVPLRENQGNRRTTILSEWDQRYWPFAYVTVRRYLKRGYTREEIICQALEVVRSRGSHYRHVQAKLESMISDLPDHVTVLPYRTN